MYARPDQAKTTDLLLNDHFAHTRTPHSPWGGGVKERDRSRRAVRSVSWRAGERAGRRAGGWGGGGGGWGLASDDLCVDVGGIRLEQGRVRGDGHDVSVLRDDAGTRQGKMGQYREGD